MDNAKYLRFVKNYFYGPPGVVGNAYKSAKAAGYAEKTAEKNAPTWVTADTEKNREKAMNKVIYDLVQAERGKLKDELGVTREQIVNEYRRCGLLNPKAFFGPDGGLKSIHDIDDDAAAAISGFDVGETGISKIRLVDKKGALDSLSRIKGLFVDKVEHSGPGGGPIKVDSITDDERKVLQDAAKKLAEQASRGA